MTETNYDWKAFIEAALQEDIREGDFSSLCCIPNSAIGKAQLKVKQTGIIAGVELAEKIFAYLDSSSRFNLLIKDGTAVTPGDIAFEITCSTQTLLKAERLVLNCMQRMSAIATLTAEYVNEIKHTNAIILDTRKTTPLFRYFEKWAVRIGGGQNHRFGLYDMIMLKDNHIDFAGGIPQAIAAAKKYLQENNLNLKIEVETRNLQEVQQVLDGGADRIMFDNFSLADLKQGVALVNKKIATEASGGVNLQTIKSIAETGVDFISVGALTHGVKSLDLSLKAVV